MSDYQDRYNELRSDEDAIKPIDDRDGTDAERRREHYREFNAWLLRICKDRELSDAQKVILIFVGLHFNHKNGECFPSQAYLAIELLYSKQTIINALKAGQARGHLDWPENRGRHKNQYVLFNTPNQAGGLTRPKTINHANGSKEESERPPEEASKKPRDERNRFVSTKPASEEKKAETAEASKPKEPPRLEEVKGPIAYISVADHEQHLDAIEHYDLLVGRVRERHPEVEKLKLYVRRLNGGAGVMSGADPRLVALRLAGSWGRKVELDQMTLDNAWDLLLERLAAVNPAFATCPTCGQTPCPNPGYCQSCRSADQKIQADRKCAQCGAGGELEPHQWREKRTIVYLHRGGCERFWKARHR
jgi:Helix-turn-helix domain